MIKRTNVGERAKAMKKTGLKVRYVSDRTEDRFFSILIGVSKVLMHSSAPPSGEFSCHVHPDVSLSKCSGKVL